MSSSKQTTTKQTIPKKEEKVIEKVVEKVVEKVAEKSPDPTQEVDDENVEVIEEVVEVIDETGKKTKKVEYASESLEDAAEELTKVDGEIEQKMRYRKAVFKVYQKLVSKQNKQNKKHKQRNSETQKEKTGFTKPNPIPEVFKEFYNKHLKDDKALEEKLTDESSGKKFNIGEDQPRTLITKALYYYIRNKNLYEKNEDGTDNKRKIKPDEELTKLLTLKPEEKVGFSNFQTYVSRIYGTEEKEEKVETAVAKPKTSSPTPTTTTTPATVPPQTSAQAVKKVK